MMKPPSISKNSSNDKLVLRSSAAMLVYFSALAALSYAKIDIVIVGVFIELLTIPLILMLAVLTVVAIKGSVNAKFNIRSNYFISLVLLALTITVLTIATIYG